MSEPRLRIHALIGTAAGVDRLCQIVELTEEEGPLGLVRAALFASGLFVPARGNVDQFAQILSRFGYQALPRRLGLGSPGDLYVASDGSIGFMVRPWLMAGQEHGAYASFDALGQGGEHRREVESVDYWLRLPGGG